MNGGRRSVFIVVIVFALLERLILSRANDAVFFRVLLVCVVSAFAAKVGTDFDRFIR